jgi:hypothetical protein
MDPLFSSETATAHTLELASIPENHVPMLLLLSEARLLLVAGTSPGICAIPVRYNHTHFIHIPQHTTQHQQ